MDLVHALRILRRRWWWAAIGVLPAAYLALSASYHVGFSGLHKKSLEYGAAQTQLLVDSPDSILASATQDASGLSTRADVFAQLFKANPVKAEIGRLLHVPAGAIAVTVPDLSLSNVQIVPTAGTTNAGLAQASDALQLEVLTQQNLPLISLYTQGPTGEAAAALANAAARALHDYVSTLKPFLPSKAQLAQANKLGIPPASRVTVSQLGVAQGGMVNSGASKSIALLVFVGLLVLDCIIVIMIGGLVERRDESRQIDDGGREALADFDAPGDPLDATSGRDLEAALAASRE